MKKFSYLATGLFLMLSTLINPDKLIAQVSNQNGIEIYTENAHYWQYNGNPVLLIGGSGDDNIFQAPLVEQEVQLLKSVGGNYLRCAMSARDEGDAKPYLKDENGKYDLEKFNPEYWDRFKHFLEVTAENDIIVQIELWATYDFYQRPEGWDENPFNPLNNSNYSSAQSGLPEKISYLAWEKNNPFFNAVPALDNNQLLLKYQHEFIDKIIELSFPYRHVLYSIDNETNAHPEWGKYWAGYLKIKANNLDKKIYVTEMWDNWDPTNGNVDGIRELQFDGNHTYLERSTPLNTIDHPEIYDFIDISNHNGQFGQVHYETGLWVRNRVIEKDMVRPINNVKMYGGLRATDWTRGSQEGIERFWRNIFKGHAAVRFHRPPSGIGLNHQAQHQIKSARMLTHVVDFFTLEPSNHLLGGRHDNEAYCLANEKNEYLLYFPGLGDVSLRAAEGEYIMMKLDTENATWAYPQTIELPGQILTRNDYPCVIVLKKK